MTNFTLDGSRLDVPMVPELGDNPPVLPWRVERYAFNWSYEHLHATMSVSEYRSAARQAKPWFACCFGPGDATFQEWFATPEEGQAAIETHVAEWVRLILSETEA